MIMNGHREGTAPAVETLTASDIALCARAGPTVSLRLASPYTLRASRCARGSCYGEGSPARDPRARPSHLCSMGRKRGRAHSLHRAPWLPCAMGLLADGIRMPLAGPKERVRSPERAHGLERMRTGRKRKRRSAQGAPPSSVMAVEQCELRGERPECAADVAFAEPLERAIAKLTDAFAGDAEHGTDLFERVFASALETEVEPQYLCVAWW